MAALYLLPALSTSLSDATRAIAGESMLRTIAPSAHHTGGRRLNGAYVSQLEDGRVVLGRGKTPEGVAWTAGPLPFENALSCPVSSPGGVGVPPRDEYVRVAVAVVLRDVHGHVLLTRRCRHMRTFPQAWVCPGGGVDTGESLVDAAAREVREETGLEVAPSALKPLCLWESCFPTTAEGCKKIGQLKSHHLIVIFEARMPLPCRPTVALQVEETDAALWLHPKHFWAFHRGSSHQIADHHNVKLSIAHQTDSSAPDRVYLKDIAQKYPSADGLLNGMGEAYLFALAEVAAQSSAVASCATALRIMRSLVCGG